MKLNQFSLPARDLSDSILFYEKLGLRLIVESENYARFEVPDGFATLSLHADENPSSGAYVYFECDDLDLRVRLLKEKGLVFASDLEDKRWLWREAWLVDPAGNQVCLYFAGKNRRFPPWRLDGKTGD